MFCCFLDVSLGSLAKRQNLTLIILIVAAVTSLAPGIKTQVSFFFFNWVIKQMTLPNYIALRFDQTQKNLGNLWVHCFSARKFSLSSCCILELCELHPSFLSVLIKAKSWLFRVGSVNFRHLCYANTCLSSHWMWVECCPS